MTSGRVDWARRMLGALTVLAASVALAALSPREEARRILAEDFAALERGETTLAQVGVRARTCAETAATPELSAMLLAGAVRLFERAGDEESAAAARRQLEAALLRCRRKPDAGGGAGRYCVVDLSAGPDAERYAVSSFDEPPADGWQDVYKTRKLVLRRIEPGAAVLVGKGAAQRRVTVSAPYYLGVFEVTQGQWELVMGTRPSFWRGEDYAKRPVECVSFALVRGDGQDGSGKDSGGRDAKTFVGRLRERTGLAWDLPTECQWEYACAAGRSGDYHDGGCCDSRKRNAAMDGIGRYRFNGGWNEAAWGKFAWRTFDRAADRECGTTNGTASVGTYRPNRWGLYDMHGNVWEWCLDRDETHPDRRMTRGGWWLDDAGECCLDVRKSSSLDSAGVMNGFRLCLPCETRLTPQPSRNPGGSGVE